MGQTWIVVADSSRARIFSADTPSSPLHELEDLTHPEGRMHSRDLTSDLPGSNVNHMGSGTHRIESEVEPKKQEAVTFAKHLVKHLDSARKARNYTHLILIAAPSFLGMLRDQLAAPLRKMISLELNQNLTQHNSTEIRKHLPEFLPSNLT